MGRVSIHMDGLDELSRAFVVSQREIPDALHKALREEAEEAFRLSQEVVPVDTGVLRSSGIVESQVTSGGATAQISYGGGAASYAIYVHELPPARARHASPTQWKFLERPVKLYSRGMADRMRTRMTDILVRRFSI